MPNTDNILLEAHEDRIKDLERQLTSLSNQILPVLARLEQVVTNGFERVNDRMDDGEERFERLERGLREIEIAAREDTARDIARDNTVASLQLAESERKDRRKAVWKWVGGITATVLTAIILALFGLAS